MLNPGRVVVPVEILLDLALLLSFRGLVDRHFDQVIPARHHFGHERGVLRTNVLIVEVLEHGESEDLLIPLHPVIHLAFFNVTDCVVDILEAARVLSVVVVERVALDLSEAGHEEPAVLERR